SVSARGATVRGLNGQPGVDTSCTCAARNDKKRTRGMASEIARRAAAQHPLDAAQASRADDQEVDMAAELRELTPRLSEPDLGVECEQAALGLQAGVEQVVGRRGHVARDRLAVWEILERDDR